MMSAARGRSSKAQEGNRLPFSRASAFSVLRGSSSSSSSSSGSGGEESDDGDDVTLPKGLKPWQQEGATTSPRSQVEEEESLSSGSSSSSSFDSDGSSEKDQGSQDTSSRAPGEGITRGRGQAVGEHMSPELPTTSNVAAFREERSQAATLLQRVQRGHAVRKRLQPTDDSRASGNNNNEESKAAAAAEIQPRSRRLSDTPISQDLSGVGSDSDDDDDDDSEEPRSQGSTEASHGPERRAEDVTEGPRTGMIHDERTDDQESDASSADSDQDGDSSSKEEYGEHSVATHSTSETEYAPAVRRGVVGRLLSGLADFLFSSPEPDSAAETGRDSAVSDLESSWGTLVGEETSREQSPEGDDGRSSSLRGSPTIDHHPVSSPLSQPSGLDSVSGSSRSVTPMAAAPSPVDDLVANQDDQAVEETATPSPVGAPEVQSDSVADESPIEEQGGGLLRRGLVRLVQGGLGFFVGSATNEHLDRDDLPDNYRHEQEPEDTSRDSVGDPQRPDSALDSALDALVEGITEVEGGRSDEEKEDSPRVEELSSSSDEKEDDESEAASVTSQGTKGAVRQDAWAIATSVHSQSIGSQDVIAAPAPAIWQHPSPLISASSLQDTFIPSDMLPGVEEKLTRRISDDGTTIAPIKVLYSSTASSKADDAKLLSSAGPAHAPSHAEDHDDFSSMADEIYQGLHSRDDHSHVVGGGPSTSHQDSILWSCGRPNQTWDGLRSQTPSANASESLASLAFNTFKPLTDRQSSRHTWAASPEGDNDVKGTEGARAAEPKEDKGHDAMSAAIWGSKFGMKDDPVGAKLLPVADTKEVLQSSPSRQRGMKPIESPKREQSKSSPLRASASLTQNRHDGNNSASSSDGSRSRSNSSCSGEIDAFDGFFTPPLARQQRRGRGRRHRLSPSLVEIKDDHDTDYFQAWDYNTTTNEVQRTPTPASTVTSDHTGDDMTGASGTDDTSSFKSQDDASASSSNPSPVSQEEALSSPVPVLPQVEEVSPQRESSSSSSSSEGESDESLDDQAAERREVHNDVVKVVAVTVIDTKTALIKLQRAWRRSRGRRQRHLTSEAIIQDDQLGELGRHTSDHVQLQASEVRDSGRSEHHSATHIQRLIRGYPRRREFCRVRKATITIQAVVRGVKSRHRHRKQVDSIVRMQASIRTWLARRNLQGLRAVVRIQARARARAAQAAYLTKLQNRKACAATKIQATYRGLRTRQSYRQVVQARRVSLATIMIQKHARGLVAHERFQAFRRAVVAVQSSFRRHRDKRAVVLQQWARGFIHRRSFLGKLQAVIILQRMARGSQARRRLARALHCLRFIQRWYRVVSRRRHSLIKIQAWARGLLARQKYLRCQASVRRIQSWYRREQKRVSQPDVVQSWDVILKWTHVYKSREKYATIIRSIRAVQLRFRARHDAKVIKVQALWRGILGRRHAAQVLEDTRRQEMMVIKAAEIQRVWRGTLARFVARQIRADQALEKRQQASAALLQRVYRGAVIRREVTVIKETIARQKEEALRWLATVMIQRAWRQHHAYKKICYRRALALVARQHYEEQEPVRRHEAALRIQGMVRHVWFKRRLRYHRVLRVVKVYHCAEYARAYLSAVQIQRAWRNYHGLTYHGPVVGQEEVNEEEDVAAVEELDEEKQYPQLVNLLKARKAMTRWLTGGLRLRRLSDPQAHLPEERRVEAPTITEQQAAAEVQIAPPELVEGGGGRLMAILRRRASSQSVGRLEVVEEEKPHTANEVSQTMTVETAPVEGQPQPPTTTTTTTTAPPSRRPSITLASLANFILPRRLSAASTSDVRGEEVEDAVDDKDHTCDAREEEVAEKTDEGDDEPERREDTQEKEVEDDLVARPRRRSSFGFFSFDWSKPRANSAAPHDGKIMKEDLMPDSKAKQDGVKTQQAKTEEDDVVELDLAEKRRRGSSLSAPSANPTSIPSPGSCLLP